MRIRKSVGMVPATILVVEPAGPSLVLDHRPLDLRSEGGPKWETLDVAQGRDVLEYRGQSLHQMDLDLWFDATCDARGDIEHELRLLHLLTQPRSDGQPGTPVVRLNFGVGQQLFWVVRGPLDWQQITRSPRTGRRVQARVTLPLIEYRVPALVGKEKA